MTGRGLLLDLGGTAFGSGLERLALLGEREPAVRSIAPRRGPLGPEPDPLREAMLRGDLTERGHWLGRSDEDVARVWLASGPALVVVTRGGAGVYAVSARLELRRDAVPIDLVDTVGAGDSFTSGLLDGLHRADLIGGARRDALAAIDQATLGSVIDEAVQVAAITCSKPGADPPTRAEVDAALAAGRPA